MNRGQLNGFAFNAGVLDPVVRIQIKGAAYARGRARGRVYASIQVQARGRAVQYSRGWRVEAPLQLVSQARAAIDGVIGRVDVRSLLQSTGRVQVQVVLPPVRARVGMTAKAHAEITAHALARIGALAKGRAVLKPYVSRLTRGPVSGRPTAKIAADGVVYVRRYLRSALDAKAQAYVVTTDRIHARLSALVSAQAIGHADYLVLSREPVAAQAVVLIEINPDVHKRLPYDEPAPESRTFMVPAGMFTFYVTE